MTHRMDEIWGQLEKAFNLEGAKFAKYSDFLKDYKSLLQEDVQTTKKSVEYTLVKESGPAHCKEFIVSVSVDGIVYGYGKGRSKKEAEQNAAKDALNKKA